MTAPSTTLQIAASFFHENSKQHVRASHQYLYNSPYRGGHVTQATDVLASDIPWFSDFNDLDSWISDNPGIIQKYTQFPISPIPGMNNESWRVMDNSTWMRPIIVPEMIPQVGTGLRASAYQYYLYPDSDLVDPIALSTGTWWVEPFSGVIRFDSTQRPQDLGWGTPLLTCYVYVGSYLQDVLTALTPRVFKYASNAPSTIHNLNHNFNSLDLNVSIVVQDPVTQTWSSDIVGTDYSDLNTVYVHLTEASNIRATIEAM